MTTAADQPLLRRTLARMDEAWEVFRRRATAVSTQQLEVRTIEGGWTRKQMLSHIVTWHELTVERLARLRETGERSELPETTDAINARASRSADGRSTGEVVFGLDDSYRRLRREVSRLTDEHLAAHDGWGAGIIAANTFEHYAEHLRDL
jgi:DinB superfamily